MSLPRFEYDELLRIQREHLHIWRERLKPSLFKEVSDYVLAQNNPNGSYVIRGQDLIQVIRDWPNLLPVYPPINQQPQNEDQDVI